MWRYFHRRGGRRALTGAGAGHHTAISEPISALLGPSLTPLTATQVYARDYFGTCQDLADDQFVCRSSPWRLKGSGLVMFSAVLPACFMENYHLVSVWYTESHSHYFRPVRSWWSSTACLSPEQKISLSRMTLLASHHPYLPQPRHCGPCGRVERWLEPVKSKKTD